MPLHWIESESFDNAVRLNNEGDWICLYESLTLLRFADLLVYICL